jgi:hypothetical protein
MNNTIYIRTLKKAEHTVFCVQDGQKTYYDPQFNKRMPFSSGQQIKRSLLDTLNTKLNTTGSPTTFLWDITKKDELKEGEVYGTCDPSYADQLFGGWMKAAKGGKEKTLKRRSPLSISAMRALHPLLAGTGQENITFDRSDRSNNEIIVRDSKGNRLSDDEIANFLEGKDRSLRRKWIPNNRRATGLFVQDIAIDLRRLFAVTLNEFEPEITGEKEIVLREEGWIERKNIFGPCLIAPKKLRGDWINALTDAVVDWRITSNQSRTFSLMETLAIAISENPQEVSTAIRAKLTEEEQAKPVIEEDMEDVYVTPAASGHFITSKESVGALESAKNRLIEIMGAFPYENQTSVTTN